MSITNLEQLKQLAVDQKEIEDRCADVANKYTNIIGPVDHYGYCGTTSFTWMLCQPDAEGVTKMRVWFSGGKACAEKLYSLYFPVEYLFLSEDELVRILKEKKREDDKRRKQEEEEYRRRCQEAEDARIEREYAELQERRKAKKHN